MTVDPSVRAAVLARVDELAPELVALSHASAADPELAYEEYRSMARCADACGSSLQLQPSLDQRKAERHHRGRASFR